MTVGVWVAVAGMAVGVVVLVGVAVGGIAIGVAVLVGVAVAGIAIGVAVLVGVGVGVAVLLFLLEILCSTADKKIWFVRPCVWPAAKLSVPLLCARPAYSSESN